MWGRGRGKSPPAPINLKNKKMTPYHHHKTQNLPTSTKIQFSLFWCSFWKCLEILSFSCNFGTSKKFPGPPHSLRKIHIPQGIQFFGTTHPPPPIFFFCRGRSHVHLHVQICLYVHVHMQKMCMCRTICCVLIHLFHFLIFFLNFLFDFFNF